MRVGVRVLVPLVLAGALGWLPGCGPSARPSANDSSPASSPPRIGAADLPAERSGGSPQLPSAPAAAPPSQDDLELCVAETNRYRRAGGKPPVTRSAALEAYALEGARYDSRARQPHKHFSDTNGGNLAFAENECLGFQGWTLEYAGGSTRAAVQKCLQAFHDEGPGGGHYENMMSAKYKTLGCAVYVDGGSVSIVQDFGF